MTNIASKIQDQALEFAAKLSSQFSEQSVTLIRQIIIRNNIPYSLIEQSLQVIRNKTQVAIHFHPDRLLANGETVAESLLRTGKFQNQFETGISNGALTPFSGGKRDNWEHKLFGGVYQHASTLFTDRPKYGALDLAGHSNGPAPRFGSCYFKLSSLVNQYCSFSEKDSYYEPEIYGTAQHFEGILMALLHRVEQREEILGLHGFSVQTFLERLIRIDNKRVNHSAAFGKTLDDYIEAQIHCNIDLAEDITALVADPSFKNTVAEDVLIALCERYSIALDWHAGFIVATEDINDEFRGPQVPALAKCIQENGCITAELIGRTAKQVITNPELWKDSTEDTLQQLKQLWHCVVHFGKPLMTTPIKTE